MVTGEAKFQYPAREDAEEVQDGLKRATKHIDTCLNLIGGRLGLDHDRVFFGRFGVPVMVRYLDQREGPLTEVERDKLLFWFVQSGMWGRFSGSTESYIDQDLHALEGPDGGLEQLLEQLRLWHGGLRTEPGHFTGWGLGARFYPVLYLSRAWATPRDWGTGLELKANLLGEDEPPGGASHLPEGAALQAELQQVRSECAGQLLLPHQGHEPGHQRPVAGGVLPRGRGGAPRCVGVAVDPE